MKRLNFGEHKDEPIQDVPTDYLVFIATHRHVKPNQKKIAIDELVERGQQDRLPSKVKHIKP